MRNVKKTASAGAVCILWSGHHHFWRLTFDYTSKKAAANLYGASCAEVIK